jgi:hypothetical protein
VILLLVFLMLVVGLFALFLGGGLLAQGYLYQNPAERMPLRAVAGAVLVGGFITFWMWIDQRAPGRYDTFFNFSPHTTVEFNEFEAVRWSGAGDGKFKLDAGGKPVETIVKFKRTPGGKGQFLEDGTDKTFSRSGGTSGGTSYATGAILVKGPGDAAPVRYNATMKENPNTKTKTYTPEVKFEEEKGSRYVSESNIGTLYVPSTGTVVGALLLNFMLVVVWLVAFWPILRFSLAHALVFTASLAIITMLAIMPLLFKQNRISKPAPGAPPAAIRGQEPGIRGQGRTAA